NWTPRTGRERLDLFFGRVIHVNDTVVSGASKANLAPRDLVFCIDVSGSMFGGSGGNTNNSGTTMLPLLLGNIYTASSVSGRYPQWYDKATYYNNYQKQWEDSMSNETWGTTTQRNAFVAQEFPDRDSAEPWKHWKWKAFCDWNFASSGGGFNTVGSARVYNGNGETQNFNVPMTKAGRLVTRSTAAGASGSEKGQKFNPSGAANSNVGAMMGPEDYTCFCVWNGYIPCVRGQKYYPRDGDGVAGLDNPSNVIAQDANTPYPTSIVYYPKVRDVENFNKALMGSGASFTGIYPGNVDAKSMSTVRQAALFGLNAMIESEIQGNAEIVFNQVGMVTFGTFAHPDLDLTNQLDYALRAGVSRITTNPGNPYITPHACGATNIGMGIRYSVRMLTDPYGKGRSFANKSIALLTDGEPNYSPSPAGNYEGNEFNGNTQTLNGPNDTASARAYGEYWADKCKSLDIQLHCIGLGLGASGQTYLEGLAQRGGGIFEHITDAQAQKQDLINLFVLIAKDKLGKLYLQ
ncbi:MAG TPA: vWA domain-containing protein, partial [Pirellulales bacterium]